jgi:hypothetical protein
MTLGRDGPVGINDPYASERIFILGTRGHEPLIAWLPPGIRRVIGVRGHDHTRDTHTYQCEGGDHYCPALVFEPRLHH